MKIYLAGKMAKMCWRHQVVADLARVSNEFEPLGSTTWPIIKNGIANVFDYVGPYFSECHNPNANINQIRKNIALCSEIAILQADIVFAWINDPTAFGTLVELGMAKVLLGASMPKDKKIYVAFSDDRLKEDMWLASGVATSSVLAENPVGALASYLYATQPGVFDPSKLRISSLST